MYVCVILVHVIDFFDFIVVCVIAVIGNGGTTDRYVWTQTLSDLIVNIKLPPGTKAKNLDVTIKNTSLKVCFF